MTELGESRNAGPSESRPLDMRRLHTLLGACALLFALTACAEQQPDVGFGGEPPAASKSQEHGDQQRKRIKPKPVDQREPVAAKQVDTSALPEGHPKEVWTQRNGKVVVATGQEGGCSRVHAELVRQGPERVEVRFVDVMPKPSGPCTMDLRYPAVAVELDKTLGDRTVVLTREERTVPSEKLDSPPK